MKFLQIGNGWKLEKKCMEVEKKTASAIKKGVKRTIEEQEAPTD